MSVARETFASRFGTVMTMVGVAVGLGNVWRFPYLVGRYGGAAFVVLYLGMVLAIGVPGLMAEWSLGRATRKGTVGAFARAGLPFGGALGWMLFVVVVAATAYYTNVVGWVLYFAGGEVLRGAGISLRSAAILPPAEGFDLTSLLLQLAATSVVTLGAVLILIKGLRRGIERASSWIMPSLFVILLVLIARSLTLPNAWAGVEWYILKLQVSDLTPRVAIAALGHAIFTLSLGGTFMVTYGSYLPEGDDLRANATWTALGDAAAGLLAGLAIFPAVFAFGLTPGSGPGLLFDTLPRVFDSMHGGWIFALLFFVGLFGAAFLSAVAAFEVLIAGLVDNTGLTRRRAAWTAGGLCLLCAVPPMLNMRIFVPWDLTFGSGMQTFGALMAALTVGWAMKRGDALRALSAADSTVPAWLFLWIRYVIPAAILSVGLWWFVTAVLGAAEAI
ncbi:MAG: sodium-dependent transporter [Gemmatimonadaceae bacterium]